MPGHICSSSFCIESRHPSPPMFFQIIEHIWGELDRRVRHIILHHRLLSDVIRTHKCMNGQKMPDWYWREWLTHKVLPLDDLDLSYNYLQFDMYMAGLFPKCPKHQWHSFYQCRTWTSHTSTFVLPSNSIQDHSFDDRYFLTILNLTMEDFYNIFFLQLKF